jgi:hypothetical protein
MKLPSISRYCLLLALPLSLPLLIVSAPRSRGVQEFLDFIGERIALKGWTKFRGGLNTKCPLLPSIYVWKLMYDEAQRT